MSYHQWLTCAPKHHLTSSTADGFSSFKLNTAHRCSQQSGSQMDQHAHRRMPPPSRSATQSKQASIWTLNEGEVAAGDDFSKYPVVSFQAGFQLVTPPAEIDDVVQSGEEMYPLFHDFDFCNLQVTAAQVGHPNQPYHLPASAPTPPSNTRLSRDQKSGSNPGPGQKKNGGRASLPSPPASPKVSTRASPTAVRRPKPTSSRPTADKICRRGYNDPMFQTSIDPQYWAVNCTVLKSDTMIEPGNVISPTCMVGLPFGGMVEMTLPLPRDDSAIFYKNV